MKSTKDTYVGYWYIPNSTPKKWTGTLTFTNENHILLDFVTTRDDLKIIAPEIFQQVNNMNHQIPISLINGYAKNSVSNKDIAFTLIDLELIAYSQSGLISLTLEAKYCLNYYEIKDKKHLLFKKLMLKFDGFDDWMDKYGFQVNSDDDPYVFSTEVKFDQPKPIELLKTDDLFIYFYFRASSPGFLINGPKAVIEQSVFLNIDFKDYTCLDEIEYFIEKIQNLFTLINTYPTQRTCCQVRLYQDEKNPNPRIGNDTLDFIFMERVPDFSEHIKRGSFLFSFSEYENKFPEFVNNWFRLYQLYAPALDQYFDTLYFNQGHIISRFVNILSVLEIYHARKFKQKVDLKEKIIQLINQTDDINTKHFKLDETFVDEVILIRKYFVHGNEVKTKFTDSMQRKENISKHVRSLENLFKIHLLLEVGLNEVELSSMINRKPWQWGISNH